jgi:hypothetical protein
MTRSVFDDPWLVHTAEWAARAEFTPEQIRRAASKGSHYVGGVYDIRTGRWSGGRWEFDWAKPRATL